MVTFFNFLKTKSDQTHQMALIFKKNLGGGGEGHAPNHLKKAFTWFCHAQQATCTFQLW